MPLLHITQGGPKAYSGRLPKLVEVAFGRISIVNGVSRTVIDEPFAFKAADNYFQAEDPEYATHRMNLLRGSVTEQIRGKLWELSIPYEMVRMFENKIVSSRAFRHDMVPHPMFDLKASIVGWHGRMRTTKEEEIPMADFLNAHVNFNSQRNGDLVPPFLFPRESDSGPDLVFVVRFGKGAVSYTCPVFVQVKLVQTLYGKERKLACSTVEPGKIKEGHKTDVRQFCGDHGHYVSFIVAYPATIAHFFDQRPVLEYHADFDVTQIALIIDHNNIADLFEKKHIEAVSYMKRNTENYEVDRDSIKRRRG